jgi:predicted RNA-binding Zn-ribbon protein involved in translation (DUF1610 family)
MAKTTGISLPPDVCAACNAILRSHAEVSDFLRKCADCGYDVQDRIDAVDSAKRLAESVKRNFFPFEP